jgi:hypothetical protein
MRYRVRTPDGELDYPSQEDLVRAYTQGLVGPEDEVLEQGHATWRKAASLPALVRAQPRASGLAGRAQRWTVLLVVMLGMGALRLILDDSPQKRILGVVLALVVGLMLSRVTYKAFRR